ncbi:glycosyltransferase family 39 protein, partial [Patescibacteria group bacterium]|nr:glycosyltransferase family 39 protein [Patescibacteria group bacterium]
MISRRVTLLLLLIIILLGLGVRSFELTARSLWFDEAFSWRLIQFPLPELLARDAQDVHPPLYYIVLKGWASFFGSTLLALRSFSVVLGGLTIVASYLFAAAASRRRAVGLTAASLIAASGFQIQYAWEARMYTLDTALILFASWVLLLAVRKTVAGSRLAVVLPLWISYAILAASTIYVHYFAFFALVAHAVFVLFLAFTLARAKGRAASLKRLLGLASFALIIIIVVYLPWLPTLLAQNQQVQTNYWIPAIGGWSIPDTFYRMFWPTPDVPRHLGVGWIAVASTPIIATLLGWLWLGLSTRRLRSVRDGVWLTVLSGIIPFLLTISLSLLGQSLYQDRFFVFTHLFIVIGVALLLHQLPQQVRRAAIGIVIIGFLVASYQYWLRLDIPAHPGAHAVARHVLDTMTPNETIVVSSPFVYFAIDHYAQEEYDGQTDPLLYSQTGELLHFSGGPILTEDDIIGPSYFEESSIKQVWVIDTSGFGESALVLPDDWQATETI